MIMYIIYAYVYDIKLVHIYGLQPIFNGDIRYIHIYIYIHIYTTYIHIFNKYVDIYIYIHIDACFPLFVRNLLGL